MELWKKGFEWVPKAQYLLLTSIYEVEPQAIDVLKAELSVPIYTVGPAIPYFNLNHTCSRSYLEWLDNQPNGCVLYISQGSRYSVPKAQMDEIACGLRESEVRFLWVAREEASRLKEICGEKGLVVAWCDQLKVLCHPAIGGFWSHCGWNSTKEGVFAGVPFLTFPIVMDQGFDSKMIVEEWKVGWRVKEDVEVDTLVSKHHIVRLLKKFVDLGCEEGRGMRKRAAELKHVCQRAIQNGGSAQNDINAFVREIEKMAMIQG